MTDQKITLDCAPGPTRPGDLLASVLLDTRIDINNREPESMFFGAWTWDFSDVPEDVWNDAHDKIGERITALYHEGHIRYGSW